MYIQPRKGEEVQGAYTFRNRRDLKYQAGMIEIEPKSGSATQTSPTDTDHTVPDFCIYPTHTDADDITNQVLSPTANFHFRTVQS